MSEKFVNPYNFVSLPQTPCIRKERDEGASTFKGFIECTLETKTPIFIPGFSGTKNNSQSNEHYFFSYASSEPTSNPKEPVIPGSDLRGVIRNVYETITNSCLSTSEELMFGTRDIPQNKKMGVTGIKRKPGIMQYDEIEKCWYIIPAYKYKIRTYDPSIIEFLKNEDNKNPLFKDQRNFGKFAYTGIHVRFEIGEKTNLAVYLNKISIDKNGKASPNVGVLKIGNEGIRAINLKDGTKTRLPNHTVFVPIDGEERIKVSKRALDAYAEILQDYADEKINQKFKADQHSGYKAEFILLNKKAEHGVYYSENDGFCYISPAELGRTKFNTNLHDILKKNGYESCSTRKNLEKVCPGCQLFGITGTGSKTEGKTSRVRVTDATLIENTNLNYRKIKIELSSPRYSNPQFYFQALGGKPVFSKSDMFDYDDFSGNNPQYRINGRKFYWHHPEAVDIKKVKTAENSSSGLVKTINPLLAGPKFSFKVYFDNITEEELNYLAFSLNFGSNDNDNCHKIGSAKPLGLGSVKIKIDHIKVLNEINFKAKTMDELISFSEYSQKEPEFPSLKIKNETLAITNFNFLKGKEITYPYIIENGIRLDKGFAWFQNCPNAKLPSIDGDADKLLLEAPNVEGKNNNYNKRFNNKDNYKKNNDRYSHNNRRDFNGNNRYSSNQQRYKNKGNDRGYNGR